jgi:Possible hemagglutinin (DUF637)/Pre-toxin domain with VENN motif
MNPHSHRTIYNPTRGCLLALAQIANSSGKASGESLRPTAKQMRRKARFTWSLLSLKIAIAIGLQATLLLPLSHAAVTTSAVASAAFTSLVTQATISLANNGGNLDRTLQQMGTNESMRGLATSMATAAAMSYVSDMDFMKEMTTGADGLPIKYADQTLPNKLLIGVTNSAMGALVSTGINGGSLENNLIAATRAGMVQALSAQAANGLHLSPDEMGDVAAQIQNKLGHALIGCAVASGSGKCSSGATGAVVGEIAAELMSGGEASQLSNQGQQMLVNNARLIAAGIAAVAGLDPNVAATAATNAVENNLLYAGSAGAGRSNQWGSFKEELSRCKSNPSCDVNGVYSRYTTISNSQQGSAQRIIADGLTGIDPDGLTAAGTTIGRAVQSMNVNPADICEAGDAKCYGFVQQQNNQAAAVVRTAIGTGIAVDVGDGSVRAGTPSQGTPAVTSSSGDKSATTPIGRSGNPLIVEPGTNVPTTINGTNYSGHALDQMQGRGILPTAVQNAIATGVPFPTGPGTSGVFDPVNNFRVILNSNNGRVVTVIPGSP